LSLTTLSIAFAALYGFRNAITAKIYDLSGHLVVDKYALSSSFEETAIAVDDALMREINGFEGVHHVQPFVVKAALLKAQEDIQGILIKGVDASFDSVSFSRQMVRGRWIRPQIQGYSTEIVISDKLSRLLQLDTGDEGLLYFLQDPPRYRKVQVVGVYSTGMHEFDDRIIYGDAAMIQRINGWDGHQFSGLEVFLKSIEDIDATETALFDQLDVDLNVTSAYRLHPQIFEWLQLLNRNVLILLVIIIVVAALGMVSMVLILIMERTRMIGMLKALGANNRLLRRIFIYQGAQLLLKGLLAGNTLGLSLCALQYYGEWIPLDMENYYVRTVPISFDWSIILGLNLMIFLLVSLTLMIPVQVVSRVAPVKAIRFD
jgi:lipoprotein-releasing system permease protein